MIKDNVEQIRKRIAAASQDSPYGEDVKLVAVTKTRSVEEIEELLACGVTELGENRVQELLSKYEHFQGRVNWHLIGTLQKNKIKAIIDKVCLIHSVDSVELMKAIDKEAQKRGLNMDILFQLNVAQEPQKHGFAPEALEDALEALAECANVTLKGIMLIAPDTDDEEALRAIFIKTRNIYDKIMKYSSKYDNINCEIISMGMTNDFELAVRCGSNVVRIGRALFN